MNLTRYRIFESYVQADEMIQRVSKAVAAYRCHDGIWYDPTGKSVQAEDQTRKLDRVLTNNFIHRQKNSSEILFPIPDLNCIVALICHSKPSHSTREKISLRLKKCLSQSGNEYKATHNTLTGLLNKDAFYRELIRCLTQDTRPQPLQEADIAEAISATSIALCAIDIDYFKQVNDRFGHAYGDVVLRCVAARFEETSKALMRESGDRIQLIPAHPSGEEFHILVIGAESEVESMKIAEAIRRSISDKDLPDETEWSEIAIKMLPENFNRPHASDRRITVSIGVAQTQASAGVDSDELASKIMHSADTALYRAKATGRNCSIYHDDIVKKYGRILEHHPQVNVVAIDIGKQVNVQNGQEFKVYHPDFTGQKPFVFRDGRTERKIGVYPKISVGRIEAFDVQSDIAFCLIHEKKMPNEFPGGAHIEVVAAGDFSHLLKPDNALLKLDQLKKIIAEWPDNDVPHVCVVGVSDGDSITQKKGTAFLNRALADIYNCFDSLSLENSKIGTTTEYGVAVISRERCAFDRLKQDIDGLKKKYRDEIRFAGGMSPEENISPKNNLHFARAAASYSAIHVEKDVEVFSLRMANEYLYQLRSRGWYEQARKEYEALVEAGISNAEIENQYSLIEFVQGKYGSAIDILLNAAKRFFDAPYLWANLGYIQYRNGDYIASYESYLRAEELSSVVVNRPVHLPHFGLATYEYAKMQKDADLYPKATRLIENALKISPLTEAIKFKLESALSSLKETQ